MTAQCVVDRNPVGDGSRLCRVCTQALARDLHAVPDLVADLLITLSRQDRIAPQRNVGRSSTTPLVFDVVASRELRALHFYLSSWVRCLAEDNGIEARPENNATACAAWLVEHLALARRHDAADDIKYELHRAVVSARQATDIHEVSSRFPVGPCPRIIDAAFCDGEVLATITTDTGTAPPTMACLRCEHVWPPESWLRAGKQIRNRRDETGWRPRPRMLAQDAG